ncbi:MAG: hypothetical protein HRT64_08840 [Erythrobacter sp.]|nr:hypothetical protein [Erythrobacter sp.]
MEITTWSPAPIEGDGKASKDELLVTFDQSRAVRVLVIPALFDEANKLRRFTLTIMRALDEAGIDSALPDWPGCNESVVSLSKQSLETWQAAAKQVCKAFGATHVLSLRGGVLVAPSDLPGWRYAPVEGAKLLSGMLRAETIAAREGGRGETREDLMERGREHGLTLAGWEFGPQMLRDLETDGLEGPTALETIDQSEIGGAGLWLRAEPDEDAEQAARLATLIIESLATPDEVAS